ncbi:MAG: Gfo/Idh/MocA family oxidoreductase [Planctomycetia bacterium]|nr:Gfo/Idh/MocA family oxidoreductase [Planctomycetia bacterium]
MINIGIAGIGFMGMIHHLSYQKIRGAKVAALCEKDPVRLAGDWRTIQGNFGPRGEQMDLKGISRYSELDEMLADPKIDLVDICLPPAWHADVAVKALAAGKHVFCEKPIALTAVDAQRMVRAAAKAKRLLMIGHVLPFFPEYNFAYRAISKGRYGRLLGGHFKRIISDPSWLPDFWKSDRIGGPMLDLHVHDAHFIRLVCGMPRSVTAVGRMRGSLVEFFSSQLLFDNPRLAVTATSGAIGQQGRSFSHGYEIHLEKATLFFDFSVVDGKGELSMPLTVVESNGKVLRPDLGAGDPVLAFEAELKEVVAAVRQNRQSPILAAALAADAVTICQNEAKSVATGKTVRF